MCLATLLAEPGCPLPPEKVALIEGTTNLSPSELGFIEGDAPWLPPSSHALAHAIIDKRNRRRRCRRCRNIGLTFISWYKPRPRTCLFEYTCRICCHSIFV
jgi:hypothetical protein